MDAEERRDLYTGTHRLDEAARQGDERFRRLVDELQVGVLILGRRSEVVFANRAALALLGFSEDELIGHTALEAGSLTVREDGSPFPSEEGPGPVALTTGKPVRGVVVGFYRPAVKDRVWLLVDADPQPGPDGRPTQAIVTLSEITSLHRTEERLRESEARYRQLVEDAQDLIYRTDVRGYFTYVNPMTRRVTGYADADLLGRHLTELVREDHRGRVTGLLRSQLRDRTLSTYDEFAFLAKDGREIWVGQNVQLILEGERAVGLQAVARDITDRRRAVETLEAEQRDREAALQASRQKTAFLANMSHELRTPLNGVLGMARLLLEGPLEPEQRERAAAIAASGRELLAIVGSVLEYAELEGGKLRLKPGDVELRPLLDEAVGAFAEEASSKVLQLTATVAEDLPRAIRADGVRIGQVLGQLVGNAVKFTETGYVCLRALRAEGKDGPRVRFEVEDTGSGVSEASLPRLFQPFHQADGSLTRRHRGTGLGLAIARRLAEAMGGAIGATPREGGGSIFHLTLPLEPGAGADTPPAAAAPATAAKTPPVVLVVEDHPVNQKVTVTMLENLGYRVDAAGNGLDALQACSLTRYDAILMDCQMPDMDGFRATAWIRQREAETNRRTPIIALTASVMPGDREKCLAAGMDDYLSKPVRLQSLDATLRRWMPHPGPSPPSQRPAAEDAPASLLPPGHPLRVLEAQGRGGVVLEIIDLFLQTTPLRLEALRQVHLRGEAESLASVAHSLKGAALQLGARGMAELCARIQAQARTGGLGGVDPLLDALEAEYASVSRVLESERARFRTP
jgi:PAS domain S-box-containing protein